MTSAIVSSILKIPELNGFKANQRVFAQDVEASPPQSYSGTISSVWNDSSAFVSWDHNLSVEAERHLIHAGRVDLHHLVRQSVQRTPLNFS